MKNSHIQTTNEGAVGTANYTPGTLPKRKNTVVAAVLASLLESRIMNGMESVFKQSTTRLGAVIYYLEHKYGWNIDRRFISTGTNDGRIAEVTAYWLNQVTIAQAFNADARNWIESVKIARAERRKQSGKCKAGAALKNSNIIFKHHDPRQADLWGNV